MLKLDVQKRDPVTSLYTLRDAGKMPAVFYNKKGQSTPISVTQKDFIKVWKKAGESSVVSLVGDGIVVESLIQDVDLDPVTDVPRHADFYVFEKGQKMKVKIPLEFVGASPAVKDLAGILVKVLYEVEVEAEPKNLPHKLEVDISALVALDSQVTAKDIKLPAGVTLEINPDEVVASITVAKEEVEEVPVDLSAIEVTDQKGKEVKEGEEGAAPAEGGEKAEAPKKEAPAKK